MKIYELRTRLRLPRPRPEVFAFFADAGNLDALTNWLLVDRDVRAIFRYWEERLREIFGA